MQGIDVTIELSVKRRAAIRDCSLVFMVICLERGETPTLADDKGL